MTLSKKYHPEGFLKQKHQYMVVIIFIYTIFSYTRSLREGFWDQINRIMYYFQIDFSIDFQMQFLYIYITEFRAISSGG